MASGVYEISCTATGKRYIGSAKSFSHRWKAHRFHLDRGTHHSPHLQAAWNKYGADSFAFRVLIISKPEHAVMYEQAAMDAFDPEFNVARIAGSCLGVKRSDETRAKLAAAKIGNQHTRGMKLSPEARAKIAAGKLGNTHTKGKPRSQEAVMATAAAHRGMKRSDETRQKIAQKALGRRWSEESKAKLSAKTTGRKLSESHRATLIGNQHAAGRVQTPEERANRSAKLKAAWAARKAAGIPWR